jgi:hypothetical protein
MWCGTLRLARPDVRCLCLSHDCLNLLQCFNLVCSDAMARTQQRLLSGKGRETRVWLHI